MLALEKQDEAPTLETLDETILQAEAFLGDLEEPVRSRASRRKIAKRRRSRLPNVEVVWSFFGMFLFFCFSGFLAFGFWLWHVCSFFLLWRDLKR